MIDSLDDLEIRGLVILAQSGDVDARERILAQFHRMCWKCVRKRGIREKDREDAYQEAMIQLNRCIDKFDASSKNKFITYAMNCVQMKMMTIYKKGLSGNVVIPYTLSAKEISEAAKKEISFSYQKREDGRPFGDTLSVKAVSVDEQEMFEQMLTYLPSTEQKILKMIQEGYSETEVVGMLGNSAASFEQRVETSVACLRLLVRVQLKLPQEIVNNELKRRLIRLLLRSNTPETVSKLTGWEVASDSDKKSFGSVRVSTAKAKLALGLLVNGASLNKARKSSGIHCAALSRLAVFLGGKCRRFLGAEDNGYEHLSDTAVRRIRQVVDSREWGVDEALDYILSLPEEI